MDKMQAQIADLNAWRDSAQKQFNKLFAGLNDVEKMVRGHITSSEAHNTEIQNKLDKLIAHQDAADQKDADHDQKIADAAQDREAIRELLKSEFSKKLPMGASIVGGLGFLIQMFLDKLPEIAEFIVKISKGVQV